MFGIEHWGVEPDILTAAKGIANGTPLGVTVATAKIADSFTGLSISTFGGNPVSMAAGLATIELIEEENLAENAYVVGQYLRDGLEDLQKKYPSIGDVRGMGLMQACEFVKENKEPDAEIVSNLFCVHSWGWWMCPTGLNYCKSTRCRFTSSRKVLPGLWML